MAKSKKQKSQQQQSTKEEEKESPVMEEKKDESSNNNQEVAAAPTVASQQKQINQDESDAASSCSEDDSLVLEGVIIPRSDASSTSSGSDMDDDDDDKKPAAIPKASSATPKTNEKNDYSQKETKPTNKKKKENNNKKKKKKRKRRDEPELTFVNFIFCDMKEAYFHGLKTLLHSSSAQVYAPFSSSFADAMISNVSIGTVVSTEEDGDEANVYGFASVLPNDATSAGSSNQYNQDALGLLRESCQRQAALISPELGTKWNQLFLNNDKATKTVGWLLHSRMINLPLELVFELHQQLLLDMDWAVNNEQDAQERSSLEFDFIIRLAPLHDNEVAWFKYFEDEIMDQHAMFSFHIKSIKNNKNDNSKSKKKKEKKPQQSQSAQAAAAAGLIASNQKDGGGGGCKVIVMTRKQHLTAMDELKQLIAGGPKPNNKKKK